MQISRAFVLSPQSAVWILVPELYKITSGLLAISHFARSTQPHKCRRGIKVSESL